MKKEKSKTTVHIFKHNIVKIHILNCNEQTFNGYINRLIKEDITKNGTKDIINKYFKEK